MKTSISAVLLLIQIAFLLFNAACTEKILALEFFGSKSHKLTYEPLLIELAKKGHQITILTPIEATKKVKNVREIFTINLDETVIGSANMFEKKELKQNLNPFLMVDKFTELCSKTYDTPQVKALLNETFDLIFLQPIFNDCALGFVHHFNASLVLFYPAGVSSFIVSKIGGHFPPSFVPNVFLGYSDEMTFVQRFVNYGVSAFIEGVLRFYYEPAMAKVYRDKLGRDLPTASEILGNASLILSNGHFSLTKPKPFMPDVIDVGGIHSHPAKPIPKDLEDFVSKSGKDGFILFSMGTVIKGGMSDEKRKIFVNVFSKLKQQVLWKWGSESMPDLPKNVKLSKWLPQQDLLGHPNIKMFITHCGGGGTEEAIYHGVPLVGLPMFGDQPLNAKLAKNHGFLIDLDWNELTEEKLTSAINEILKNPNYKDNVKKLSTIFKDQIDDPLERGVYWIEYILRHKGAPHLRSAARKLNFIQYHSWDVIATYLLIVSLIVGILYRILKLIVTKIIGTFIQKTSTKKKIN